MPLIRCDDIYSLTPQSKALSLTFGNFDGVHLGHQKIISSLKNVSMLSDFKSALITFDPHPLSFFLPQKEDFLLFKEEQKFELLLKEGIDILYVIKFNRKFLQISAEEFIKILVQNLNVKHITVGTNCKFGNKALGNMHLIQNLSHKYNYKASIMEKEMLHETKEFISSSKIRLALQKGQMKEVSLCLGRFYFIIGKVMLGNKRGSLLGFPTCNVSLGGIIKPKFGVYFVRIEYRNRHYYGIANIGIRPTFNETTPLVEAYIFDFNKIIYEETIKIELLDFIREEKKFPNIDELKFQIDQDVLFAQNYLLENSNKYPI